MTRVMRKETLIIQVNMGRILDLEILKSYISIDRASLLNFDYNFYRVCVET